MSKSLSWRARPRPRGRYRFRDDYRKLFPGLPEHASIFRATYMITPLGRVYRDDGLLLRPSADKLKIQLNDGSIVRSLPLAVYRAFGRTPMTPNLCTWVSPDAPIDEMTGRRSCSVKHVVLVSRADLIRIARGTMQLDQLKTLKIR